VCHGPSLPLSTTKNSELRARPALLQSFRRHRVLNADYPAIIACTDSTVRGTLVSGLTDGDMWRLDVFEGDEYERRKVKVRVLKDEGAMNVEPTEAQLGGEVDAETYVWISGEESLEDKEWDFEEFVREKMGRWVGAGGEENGEYNGEEVRPSIIEVDEAVKVQEQNTRDPTGGRGLNGTIGKALEEGREKEKKVIQSAV